MKFVFSNFRHIRNESKKLLKGGFSMNRKHQLKKWFKKLEDFYFLHIRKYIKKPKIQFITYLLFCIAQTVPFVPSQIQYALALLVFAP